MSGPSHCAVVGCWRIVGADHWERDFLDLVEPAHLTLDDQGHGEIVFGAVQVPLDPQYGRHIVFLRFIGIDEDNDIWGDGSAEICEDGSLEIEFNTFDTDEAILTAVRETSSAACYGTGNAAARAHAHPQSAAGRVGGARLGADLR